MISQLRIWKSYDFRLRFSADFSAKSHLSSSALGGFSKVREPGGICCVSDNMGCDGEYNQQ